jgi:hypothetical protein
VADLAARKNGITGNFRHLPTAKGQVTKIDDLTMFKLAQGWRVESKTHHRVELS